MKISFLCNNIEHPVMPYLQEWIALNSVHHELALINCIANAGGGDILFLVSCSERVPEVVRSKYRKTLVLHASDLPIGRGWSPHVWDVVEGATYITLSLLEAEDIIDSGKIWKKKRIEVPKHALWDEINQLLFEAEIALVDFAVRAIDSISPKEQDRNISATYRRKRTPDDSRVSPMKSIAEQFDLIRICDPDRFPAYFDYLGHRYKIKLEKVYE